MLANFHENCVAVEVRKLSRACALEWGVGLHFCSPEQGETTIATCLVIGSQRKDLHQKDFRPIPI